MPTLRVELPCEHSEVVWLLALVDKLEEQAHRIQRNPTMPQAASSLLLRLIGALRKAALSAQ